MVPFENSSPSFGPAESMRVIKMATKSDPQLRIVWNLPYFADKTSVLSLKYFIEMFGY